MKELFIKQFIPNAKPVYDFQDKGISCFENDEELFVLIDFYVAEYFTKYLKDEISTVLLKKVKKPLKFIMMFRTRTDFSSLGKIIWGTYAWFENEPAHFIHFDNNPSKKIT